MEYIISGRRGGKTTTIIDMFMEDPKNTVIMVATAQRGHLMADQIRRRNPHIQWEKGELERQIIGPNPERLRGGRPRMLVDDLEAVLAMLFGAVPDAVAGTGVVHRPNPTEW